METETFRMRKIHHSMVFIQSIKTGGPIGGAEAVLPESELPEAGRAPDAVHGARTSPASVLVLTEDGPAGVQHRASVCAVRGWMRLSVVFAGAG